MGNGRLFSSNSAPGCPDVGQQCPVFDVRDIHGSPLVVGRTLVAGRGTLLLFMDVSLPAHTRMLSMVRAAAACEGVDVVLISPDAGADLQPSKSSGKAGLWSDPAVIGVRHVVSDAVGQQFGVGHRPFSVLLDAQGVIIAKGHCTARRHIEAIFKTQRRGYYSLYGYLSRVSRFARPVHVLP